MESILQRDKIEIKNAIELQFRCKLYQDSAFPFLHSMGIKHLFKGFEDKELGFLGILHLWWIKKNNIFYEKPQISSVPISVSWSSEWIDSPGDVIKIAEKIVSKNPFDIKKMIFIHQSYLKRFK